MYAIGMTMGGGGRDEEVRGERGERAIYNMCAPLKIASLVKCQRQISLYLALKKIHGHKSSDHGVWKGAYFFIDTLPTLYSLPATV